MSLSPMDRITDAEAVLDSLVRLTKKLKTTEAREQRIREMLQTMHINELARIASALEAHNLRNPLPHALGPMPLSGGREQNVWIWKDQHPHQFRWLQANAPSKEFARSMLQGLETFGSFTDAQQVALDRAAGKEPTP